MRSSPAAHPTTEEHRLPSSGESERGRPMLLAAFPSLADTEVSGRHLRFFCAGGRSQVEDAGSRNGTFVDGARFATATTEVEAVERLITERWPATLRDGAVRGDMSYDELERGQKLLSAGSASAPGSTR